MSQKQQMFSAMTKYMAQAGATDEDVKKFAHVLFKNAYENYDYIKCVLYPDIADPARFPAQFPLPTAVHKQKDSFTITTNASGKALLWLCPNVVFSHGASNYHVDTYGLIANGPELNFNLSETLSYTVNDTAAVSTLTTNWLGAGTDLVGNHRLRFNSNSAFESASTQWRCVAMNIKCTYIGTDDNHSGYITAGTIPDVDSYNIVTLTEQDLEDSSFAHRAKPKDGIRHICIPQDPTQIGFLDKANAGTTMTTTELHFNGLPASTNCILCEVTRIIETIPIPYYKELVPTEMPSSTSDGVSLITDAIKENPKLAGSTLKEKLQMPAPKEDWTKNESSILSTISNIWNNPFVNAIADVGASLIPGGSLVKSALDIGTNL